MAIRRSEIDQILAELSGLQAPSISQGERSGFLNQATELYRPLRERKLASFGARKGEIGQSFMDLETRLKEGAVGEQKGFEEDVNRLGLLQSGKTAAGIGSIRTNLTKGLSSAAISRAVQEADLALEQAGFETDLARQTEQEATGYADKLLQQRTTELGLKSGSLQARLDTLMKIAQLEDSRAARGAAAGSNAVFSELNKLLQGKAGGTPQGAVKLDANTAGSLKDMNTAGLVKFFKDQGKTPVQINQLTTAIRSLQDGSSYKPTDPGAISALNEIYSLMGINPSSLPKSGVSSPTYGRFRQQSSLPNFSRVNLGNLWR